MGLEKATLTNVRTREAIPVMFNPEEYTLDLGNAFAEIAIPGLRTPPIQYVRGNARQLRMELFFDTYERQSDVRAEAGRITALLDQEPTTHAPPVVLFSWGGLNFTCVLESAAQRFTMFLDNGTPVRATVTVSFREYERVAVEIRHGSFVGPPAVRTLLEGETLSQIAGEVLGDPGAWRAIAEANRIDDPRRLPVGLPIVVPSAAARPPEQR
jgi:hypothetical protein